MPKSAGILALLGEPSAKSAGPAEGGAMGGKEMALEDFAAALKAQDWAAAAEAFQRAYDECAMAHESSEGEPGAEAY